MARHRIGGGAAVAGGGFCRNFYKSDSSRLQKRSRGVARLWPGSWCTVTATTSGLTHSCIIAPLPWIDFLPFFDPINSAEKWLLPIESPSDSDTEKREKREKKV